MSTFIRFIVNVGYITTKEELTVKDNFLCFIVNIGLKQSYILIVDQNCKIPGNKDNLYNWRGKNE